MKRFIINITFFAFILLLINVLLFGITYHKYLKNYEKIDPNYETYLLSDSRAEPLADFPHEYGIYNFSAQSESYIDMLRKAQYLVRHTKVKRIIITVDDHTLSPYREKFNNSDRSAYFITANSLLEHLSKLKSDLRRVLVLFNPKSRDVIRLYAISLLKQGSHSKKLAWNALSDKEKERLAATRVESQFSDQASSEVLATALNDIIKLCENYDIELVGIKYPLTKQYIEAMGNMTYSADVIFKEKNLKIYDFKDIYYGQDDLFSNQDHLSRKGGILFSKYIANALM